MQSNTENTPKPESLKELDVAKKKIKLLTTALFFSLLIAIVAGYFWLKIKKVSQGQLVPFTELLDDSQEKSMMAEYDRGVDPTGVVNNTYKRDLNDIEGIMHDFPKLIDQLKKWESSLKLDSVCFRLAVIPNSSATDKGKLTVIIVPVKNRNMRYPFDMSKKETWSVDLGDIYP
jgi:hypothetical protein